MEEDTVVVEDGPEDQADMDAQWERLEYQQRRGVSFRDMRSLAEDSDGDDVGEAAEKAELRDILNNEEASIFEDIAIFVNKAD
jgi:hypothetical protein